MIANAIRLLYYKLVGSYNNTVICNIDVICVINAYYNWCMYINFATIFTAEVYAITNLKKNLTIRY